MSIKRVIDRDGRIYEGDLAPEELEIIVSRTGMEGSPAAEQEAVAPDEATPDQVAELKAHPEESWVESPRPKQKPEPVTPRDSIEPFDTTGLTTNVGGINDTFDPDKGKHGFQFEMPREA